MEYKESDRINAIGEVTYTSGLQQEQLSTGEGLHHSYPQVDQQKLYPFPTPHPSSLNLSSLVLHPEINLNPNLKSSEQGLYHAEGEGDGVWGRGLLNFADTLAGQPHDARTIIDAWEFHLRTLGGIVQRRYPVFLPPLQKHDRLSLYVCSPLRVGIEFDLKTPRAESILKLQHFDGYRVLVLRQAKSAIFAPHVDLIVPCHTRALPRDTNKLATPATIADIKARHAYREGIDPDHVYWKCEKACREQSVPFTARRLMKWLDNEFLPTRSLAKPKCVVCNVRPPYKGFDRCGECKWKGR